MMYNHDEDFEIFDYSIPRECEACGGVMVYKGVGEYQCEECNKHAYDDYGKIRRYIETHRTAIISEIEMATGVSQRTIRTMLKEGRFALRADSKTLMFCGICGRAIRSGRLCSECEINYHRKLEEKQRSERQVQIRGYGKVNGDAAGAMRFERDK